MAELAVHPIAQQHIQLGAGCSGWVAKWRTHSASVFHRPQLREQTEMSELGRHSWRGQ